MKDYSFTLLPHPMQDSVAYKLLRPVSAYVALLDFIRKWDLNTNGGKTDLPHIPFGFFDCPAIGTPKTYKAARDALVRFGFIDEVDHSQGFYRLSDRWRSYEPTEFERKSLGKREKARHEKMSERNKYKSRSGDKKDPLNKGMADRVSGDKKDPLNSNGNGTKIPPADGKKDPLPTEKSNPCSGGKKDPPLKKEEYKEEYEEEVEEASSSSSSSSGPEPVSVDDIVKAWNEAAEASGFRPCHALTPDRRLELVERWKDPFWRENWREAIQRITQSSFCCGGGERGWKANFGFFLKPETVTKVMEGEYDDPKRQVREGVHVHQGDDIDF